MDSSEIKNKNKLILIGPSGVGKSSILIRLCFDQFQEYNQTPSGFEFQRKSIIIHDQQFTFQIWDTPCRESQQAINPIYYRGSLNSKLLDAQIALMVYDISNQDSFHKLQYWVDQVKIHAPEDITLVLVGNKIDLIKQEQVSYEESRNYASSIGAILKFTSCKENQGIEVVENDQLQEMFRSIGENIIDQKRTKNQKNVQKTAQNQLSFNHKNSFFRCC